ncbi:hypothetical protein CerSpe_154990 [Prunus speciosa]
MSSKCSNCDCSDSSQCTKKGYSFDLVIVETENRTVDTVIMDAPAAENGGNCKCGPSCACVDCKC